MIIKNKILLNLIVFIFLINIICLLYKLINIIYKFFIVQELDLPKRYGKESWVIVTGGSSGQGKEFCLNFAKRGFNIIIIGSKRSYNTQKIINELYPNVKVEILVKNFISELKKRFTISIDEVETIKEDVVFKIPKKLN